MSNEPIKGTLVVELKGPKGTKQTRAYFVTYTNSKGKVMTKQSLTGKAKCFEDQDASDGCAIDIIIDNGQLASVTIPGKAAVEGVATVRTGSAPLRGGSGKPAAQRTGANVDATAPYNFISAQAPLGFSEEPATDRFSGTIGCRLTALTPLLVCGPQGSRSEGPTERRFFEVAGIPTIPGTSLKGMIRSAIEVLSCAPLGEGLSARKIAYRDVNSADQGTPYGRRFRSGREELCAGMLRENGSERTVVPCSWMRFDGAELGIGKCDQLTAVQKYTALQGTKPLQPVDFKDSDKMPVSGDPIGRLASAGPGVLQGVPVFTGGLWGKKYLDYVFYGHTQDQQLSVPPEVWIDFLDQLSPAQEELRAYFRKLKITAIPVFFLRRKDDDGYRITAIGLTRYFRIVAPQQPRDLAPKLATGIGLPERMFGRVGQAGGVSIGGRVRFHAATPALHGNGAKPASAKFPQNGDLVAGNPSATAVSLYLEQNIGTVQLRQGKAHQNEGLTTFASDLPVLRGRKLYWHRKTPVAPLPPNQNSNVQSRYFPLAATTAFEFSIAFERLDCVELGALLEALELPEGAAHKLGLGKAFGLGSVRVDIDQARTIVQEDRVRYSGLRARFEVAGGSKDLLDECQKKFRRAVTELRGGQEFESLIHVREFRTMTNFKNPRDPRKIGYMELKAGNDTVSYGMKPILRKPLEIPPAP